MTSPQTQHVLFIQIEAGERPSYLAKEQRIAELIVPFYEQHKKVLVLISPERIHTLDQGLWESPPESFLPHGVLPCELEGLSVFLVHRPCEIQGIDVLIVSSAIGPFEWMTQFPHVIDFVEADAPILRDQSRERFKQWRDLGITPTFEQVVHK